jgi:two-component system sensor histidine kinase/response regulator
MTKILIVDDDEKMITLYRDVLSKEGFNVLTSTNGNDGLKLADQEVPSLILLDVMMPEISGADVIDSLLRNERTRDIPVIFLTSLVTEEEVFNSKGKIGGRLYMSKSTGKKELLRRIKEVVGNQYPVS